MLCRHSLYKKKSFIAKEENYRKREKKYRNFATNLWLVRKRRIKSCCKYLTTFGDICLTLLKTFSDKITLHDFHFRKVLSDSKFYLLRLLTTRWSVAKKYLRYPSSIVKSFKFLRHFLVTDICMSLFVLSTLVCDKCECRKNSNCDTFTFIFPVAKNLH